MVDIVRLEEGKIVEHWYVSQEIPEKLPYTNGMFLMFGGGKCNLMKLNNLSSMQLLMR
jgi:hypothetical protein